MDAPLACRTVAWVELATGSGCASPWSWSPPAQPTLVRNQVDGLHRIARLNLVTAELEIRPASDADLATLVAVLGERHWFTDRLARQQRGGGVLLVAWLEGRPVGEVFLECEPANEPEVRQQLPGVPRLDHLEVLGPLWGQGIGTALIRAAEDTARQLGHERIALGVGLDNPKAWQLYERLGYADWGHGTVVGTWVEYPDDGLPVTVSEVCDMLIKRL
jgi:GNAT superfamily N-acetyltransferase